MDVDIEELHLLLLDTKLPSSIHELRNPTEEFIMNLIISFLNRFNIDVNAINKPTFEQQVTMTCLEDNDIIGIINLYVAIRQIFDRIFIPEFHISDITSSGPKKVRKFAGYLVNFLLYATNKESDMEGIINKIHVKGRTMEELQKRKKELLTLKNDKATNIYKLLASKTKYEMEIQNLHSLIESDKKKKIELEEEMIAIEEKKRKVAEDNTTYKLEIQRLDKVIADLKLEVINSPQKYQTRLYNLEEQTKANAEAREQMEETFLAKNQLIKNYENILSFVQKQYEKFCEIKDKYEHLKKVNIQGEHIKEQVNTMKNNINEIIKKRELLEEHQKTTINEIHTQTEKRLPALRELYAKLLSDMKSGAIKLEANKRLYNDSCIEKNKIQGLIKKIEEETSTFIKNCQERYDNEVLQEIHLQKTFQNAWEGSDNTTM